MNRLKALLLSERRSRLPDWGESTSVHVGSGKLLIERFAKPASMDPHRKARWLKKMNLNFFDERQTLLKPCQKFKNSSATPFSGATSE
ncbi:MAG: hypothetical protein OSA89_08075 [Mariniblastus sp.]|nr:hypothetical protein [Mariniblastus sp.]